MFKWISFSFLAFCVVSPAFAQPSTARKPAQPVKKAAAAKPVSNKAEGVPNAFTVGLRAGYNMPSSELSPGFVPDVDVGYRIGLGEIAVEPAIGWQRWSGNREVTVTSPLLLDSQKVKQDAKASVYEGRVRLWYDLKEAGYPLFGIGLGGVSADAEQTSFGEKRQESKGAITWAVQLGYAYPIEQAYGNVELLVGYRGASVDMASTGNANLSGLQILFGWHAAF